MTTASDDIPAETRSGWFGEPWPSGVCFDDDGTLRSDRRKPFPVGESCLYCREPLSEEAGDSGQAGPCLRADGTVESCYTHKECMLREVIGPLAHHEKRCHCYGGEGNGTPGMTLRKEALEVWRRLQEGTLYGRR